MTAVARKEVQTVNKTFEMSIADAKNFEQLLHTAQSFYKAGLVFVSGPMTHSAHASADENISSMKGVIDSLKFKGISVFDRVIFHDQINHIIRNMEKGAYSNIALDQFYDPLFKSGLVEGILFIGKWRDTHSCIQEYECSIKYGIPQHCMSKFKKM